MPRPIRLLACFLPLLLAAGAAPAADELDRRFGTQGHVRLAFQPQDGGHDDLGVLACSGPQGSLVVAGTASSERRIVVAWLDEHGALDTRFSGDGKHSVALPSGRAATPIGLCLPDGALLLAYEHYDGTESSDGNVHLVRLSPDTGEPDAAFGSDGTLAIDLDRHSPTPLGQIETPLGLNVGVGGEVLLTGSYTVPGTTAMDTRQGFVARIDAQGRLTAILLSPAFDPELRRFSAAVAGADGHYWAVGSHWPTGGEENARVVRLHADTLQPVDVLHPRIGQGVRSLRGVAHAGALVFAGVSSAGPLVARADAAGSQTLVLPRVAGTDASSPAQVAALPDGGLLVATALVTGSDYSGASVARIRLTSRHTLALDGSYGWNGRVVVRGLAGCASAPPQGLHRFTYWQGRPTLVGQVDGGCGSDDLDYLVSRLHPPAFGAGFE